MESLDTLRIKISDAISWRSRLHSRSKTFVELVLLVGGGILASAGPLLENPIKFPLEQWQTMSFTGVGLVGLGTIFTLFFRDNSDHLVDAAKAVRNADETREVLQDALDQQEQLYLSAERLRSLYVSQIGARGMLERALVEGVTDEESLIQKILVAMRIDLRIALGLKLSHTWTIVVYRSDFNPKDGYNHLRCIAHDRSIECDMKEARLWREGIGVGGMALARNDEVVAPDILDPSSVSLFSLNGDTLRPQDRVRYRSMFAVPVQVGSDAKPWGVVLASCNAPDHFKSPDHDWEDGLSVSYKEALRALSGVVALSIAVCRTGKQSSSLVSAPNTEGM